MLFKVLPTKINSEATVCHVLVSGALCLGEFSNGCVKQPPWLCPLPAEDISNCALGLSLLGLCSGAGRSLCWSWAVPARFTAMVARLWSVTTYVVVLNVDSKVSNGMDYTRLIDMELKVVKRLSAALWETACVRLCDGLLKKCWMPSVQTDTAGGDPSVGVVAVL